MKKRRINFDLKNKAELWCSFGEATILESTVRLEQGGVALIEERGNDADRPDRIRVRCMSDHVRITLDLDITAGVTIRVATTENDCSLAHWDPADPQAITTVVLLKSELWPVVIDHFLIPIRLAGEPIQG